MIIYRTILTRRKSFHQFICDKCKKEISNDIELQETHSINFIGGYGSVFGDGNKVECDLCQNCLKELIGDFCIYNTEEFKLVGI